jgi:hypothetical protein
MRLKQVVTFLTSFLGFQCIHASGQQVVATWTDAAGNWSNPANWSTLTVPNNGGGTTYSVTISAPSSVVTMDVLNDNIDNLTLGTATSLRIIGGLSLASGASSSSGALVIESSFNGAASVLTNMSGSSLTNNGGIGILGALFNNSGAYLINNGPILGGTPSFFAALNNSGTFINNSTMFLTEFGLGNNSGGNFANSGTIVQESGLLGNRGAFNNTGTITLYSGEDPIQFINFGTFNNSGTMTASFTNLTPNGFSNNGTLNNSGTMTVESDLLVGLPATMSNSATINNTGTLNITISSGASFSNSGTIKNTGALNIAQGLLNPGGSFDNSGTLKNSGTISNSGVFTNSGAVLINGGQFTTSTNYTQTAGRTTVDGTLTATSGAIVNIQGGTLGGKGTISGNVLMAGTMMPGDAPGTLTIFGNYEQTGTGIFKELMSPYAQAFLDMSGNVVLDPGASLDITLLGGFNPLGDTISIMDFSSLSGQFANGSSFWDDNYLWDITYRQHEVDVTAVQAPEPSSLLLLGIGSLAIGAIAKRKKVAQ